MSSDDDKKVWGAYTKGVKKIHPIKDVIPGRAKREPGIQIVSEKKPNGIPDPFSFADLSAKRKRSGMTESKKFSVTFDKKFERSMRDGTLRLDARIDLHGMTQSEAHAALEKFIDAQVKKGARHLLIITGKGKLGGGVLRTNLKLWLKILPGADEILRVAQASIKHGGSGAFYVILKKKK